MRQMRMVGSWSAGVDTPLLICGRQTQTQPPGCWGRYLHEARTAPYVPSPTLVGVANRQREMVDAGHGEIDFVALSSDDAVRGHGLNSVEADGEHCPGSGVGAVRHADSNLEPLEEPVKVELDRGTDSAQDGDEATVAT